MVWGLGDHMNTGYSPGNGEYDIALGTPTKDSTGLWSAPQITSLALASAVAAYASNPTATAALAADTLFKWGALGTTVVNHVSIQNNTAANVFYAFDASTTVAANTVYALAAGQLVTWDRSVTVLHFSSAAAQNFQGQSGISVEGYA
jgi:hypothetical protein